ARSANQWAKNVFPQPYSPRTALNTAPPPFTANNSCSRAGSNRSRPTARASRLLRATVPRRRASMISCRRRGLTVMGGPPRASQQGGDPVRPRQDGRPFRGRFLGGGRRLLLCQVPKGFGCLARWRLHRWHDGRGVRWDMHIFPPSRRRVRHLGPAGQAEVGGG